MNDLIATLLDYLHDHWIKVATAAGLMGAGWLLGRWRARSEWRRKEFLSRLNVSLNIVRDGKLHIRTLLEKSCEEVFLNSVAAERVMAAARRTSAAMATIRMSPTRAPGITMRR